MHADPAREVYVQASRKSYVTQSACVAVLKSVRKHGLPKHISRPTMKRTRVDALPHESPCGSLFSSMRLTCIDGGFLQVPVVMPWPQLYGILESSPEFADFVHESLGIANRAELGIAIYCDEILPGNALRHSNERKLLAFYWSLTNFRGQMTREEAWFHICVIRSNRVKLVKDGYTQVFKQLMSLFFESPHDIRLGVPLNFPARGLQKMFCGRISMIVGDEAALKQIWSVKGSAGTMMCMLCRNVVASVSDLDSHASGSLLPSCVTTLAGVVAHTDGSIQANAQFLASQKPIVSKAAFDRLEQGLGLSFAPNGALWSADCYDYMFGGPASATCFDWMHCFFVAGLWTSEAGLLCLNLSESFAFHNFNVFSCAFQGTTGDVYVSRCDALGKAKAGIDIEAYVAQVIFPKKVQAKSAHLAKNFKRKIGEGDLHTSASDALTLYGVLRSLLISLVPSPEGQLLKSATWL